MANLLHANPFTHPNDYRECDVPDAMRYAAVNGAPTARIFFKLPNGKFVPVTFLIATGATRAFYFSQEALNALQSRLEDGGMSLTVALQSGRSRVADAALGDPAVEAEGNWGMYGMAENVIGMEFIALTGLQIRAGRSKFAEDIEWL